MSNRGLAGSQTDWLVFALVLLSYLLAVMVGWIARGWVP